MVSTHWLTPRMLVSIGAHPWLNYGYYGFPPHTDQLKYPASGSPELAQQIVTTLSAAGVPSNTAAQHEFDHGMFVLLKLVFPQADITVVQLSLHPSLSPTAHLEVGRALESLRAQDVLMIGSGMSFRKMGDTAIRSTGRFLKLLTKG